MFKHLFKINFQGRVSRKDFWLSIIGFAILMIGVSIGLTFILTPFAKINKELFVMMVPLLFMAIGVYFGLVSLSITVRRLHDTNRSGLYLLLGFLPIIGAIAVLIFYLLPGDKVDNNYGPVSI